MDSALLGIRRETHRMDVAAAKVAQMGAVASSGQDSVEISAEARAAAAGDTAVGGIEEALVDERIAKYSAVANLKTLQTADEVSKAAIDMVKRKG